MAFNHKVLRTPFLGACSRIVDLLGNYSTRCSTSCIHAVVWKIPFGQFFRKFSLNLTQKDFPSLRPPWMVEVPGLQEQQTGRLLFSDRLLARQRIELKKQRGHSPYTLLIFFLSALNYTSNCYAEFRDPTKPAFYSEKTGTDYSQADDLNLSSIWISGRNKRATINGVTARQGEHIFSDIKLIHIHNDSVVIEQNGISRKLYLLTRSYKTR